ncbi:hypothetical protein DFAR_2650004 [Desulfarculales bacterium]
MTMTYFVAAPLEELIKFHSYRRKT